MSSAIWKRGWNAHPLRRRIDVLEARLLLVLCAVVVGCASLIGVAQGWAAYDHERSVASEQRADRHLERALVLRDATRPSPWADESGRTERVPVPVRWTDASGAPVTENAPVPVGTQRGEHTSLWLDRRGHITSAPSGNGDVWTGALAEGAGSAAVVAGVGVLAGLGVRGVCNRRRAAGWETEWSRVEPQWSRRA
ncbi:hypothetical protein [Streptomyces sp. HB132]|uniref:Rv1733c family protein n=1 Tax=Streptomyces sp. HB132 TaxID=767388 RepID=UPI001961CBF3|nr:hypothetical protein [Streptomyces sp. HB132]MBM7440253.1 hypothetical protein [Streptomyces sp. HB132]